MAELSDECIVSLRSLAKAMQSSTGYCVLPAQFVVILVQ